MTLGQAHAVLAMNEEVVAEPAHGAHRAACDSLVAAAKALVHRSGREEAVEVIVEDMEDAL